MGEQHKLADCAALDHQGWVVRTSASKLHLGLHSRHANLPWLPTRIRVLTRYLVLPRLQGVHLSCIYREVVLPRGGWPDNAARGVCCDEVCSLTSRERLWSCTIVLVWSACRNWSSFDHCDDTAKYSAWWRSVTTLEGYDKAANNGTFVHHKCQHPSERLHICV